MPPGHLAVAYLVARRQPSDRLRRALLVGLGALLPDVVDKTRMALDVTPYGRTIGHAAIVWGIAAGILLLMRRARIAGTAPVGFIVLGGISHLFVDVVDDLVEGLMYSGTVFTGWAGWPITNPDMLSVKTWHALEPLKFVTTPLELATVVTALVLVVRDRRAHELSPDRSP